MKGLCVRRWPTGRPIALVGLTGSIATGKSSAARAFHAAGAAVIDADQVAHEVVEPGKSALAEIVATFGKEVLGPDGRLDRVSLGDRVFADPEARVELNQIVHPRVAAEVARRMDGLHAGKPGRLVVYDVPLLFEADLADTVDLVVVAHIPKALQLDRLMLRDRLSLARATARIEAQLDVDLKAERAHVVLDNQGRPEDLDAVVRRLVSKIHRHNRAFNAFETSRGG